VRLGGERRARVSCGKAGEVGSGVVRLGVVRSGQAGLATLSTSAYRHGQLRSKALAHRFIVCFFRTYNRRKTNGIESK